MDHFVILDDSPRDFASLRETIQSLEADSRVEHVTSIAGLYAALSHATSKSSVMAFVDISLGGEYSSDRQGLEALQSLTASYPLIPFAVVTGHFAENIAEALRDYFHDPQIIQILDKLTYDDGDVASAILRAGEYYADTRSRMERDSSLLADALGNRPGALADFSDAVASGSQHASRRQQNKTVVEQVFRLTFRNLTFHEKATDDISHLAHGNHEWFEAAVSSLAELNEGLHDAIPGSRRIETCPGVWEIRGGRDIRIYYAPVSGRADVLRIAPKPEQLRVIDWLRASKPARK